MVFVDFTKAFDTVNHAGLWKILRNIGCPDKIVNLIEAFHEGMMAHVLNNGSVSEDFLLKNGTKQGCILAPSLFSILFSVMLNDAFKNLNKGVTI